MKRVVVFALMLVFALSSFTNTSAAGVAFKDVSSTYKDAVDYLVIKEITKGVNSTEFGTSQNIKRGDAAIFIARALELDVTNSKSQGFTDLNHRVENYVNAIVEANIASGKTETNFNPDANITRQEMARMLSNAYHLTAKSNASFTDVSARWLPYVSALKDNGITFGKTATTFAPTENLTRGEFALFIYRAEKVSDAETTRPSQQREQEIKAKWDRLKPMYTGPIMTKNNSVVAPYQLGEVHQKELVDALNLTNFVRYLAYLPDTIKLNTSYNKEAQTASLVNAVNGQITHYPTKPAGMSDEMYNLGYSGAGTSNLGVGYSSIKASIQVGYMSDDSDGNRVKVGHRRWILSPKLREVGFGFATDKNGRGHTAMKVVQSDMWRNPTTAYDTIAWPSKTAFPTNFLGAKDPWSVSLNETIYDAAKSQNVIVQLTSVRDGKKWTFSKANQADGYFNVDLGTTGYTPYTIIFQPKGINQYRQGDQYIVQISNIYKKNGQQTKIQYETTFFDL